MRAYSFFFFFFIDNIDRRHKGDGERGSGKIRLTTLALTKGV